MAPPARRSRLLLALLFPLVAAGLTACGPSPVTVSTAVDGLEIPWDVGFTPDGVMLYTERPGRISAFIGGRKRLLAAPSDVVPAFEAGMMGLSIDPRFAENRFIYTCLASTQGGPDNDVRVARWRVNASYTGLEGRTDIITGIPVKTGGELGRHSGCRPRFGPDGYLWVGTGDAAIGTTPQDRRSLAGKVLRVDRNGRGAPGNACCGFDPRVYTYGHRNVQGLAFRPGDGVAFAAEHGPDRDDEVNRLYRAGNYGWNPVPSYNEAVPMTDLDEFPQAVRAKWSSGQPTTATSGATFLTGARWKDWNGALVVAALRGERLKVFKLDGPGNVTRVQDALRGYGRLRSVTQGRDGDLYVATANGGGADRILRVRPS